MTVDHTADHTAAISRALAPRRPRLDAVLALRYRHDHGGVRVRVDDPFVLSGDRLEIPYEVWKDWRRLRLHVTPIGDVPRTVHLLADLHGNPLPGGRTGLVRGLDELDVDLLTTRAGVAFSLVLAGPGNVATIRVLLRVPDDIAALFELPDHDLPLPPPRVREIPRGWPHVTNTAPSQPVAA
jgi:hypothetical protein